MITSTSNSKVKLARALHQRRYRYAERLFLVEGIRLIEEMAQAGISPAFVFYTDLFQSDERGRALLDQLSQPGSSIYLVTHQVFQSITGTITPQGIIAGVPFPEIPTPPNPTLILIIDGVRDPGNLGTLLRSAEAAGTEHVILAAGCVDPFNSKVVRAGMGVHFRLPISMTDRWTEIAPMVTNCIVWLADMNATQAYYQINWTRSSALIIGSEARGASAEARRLATGTISIPMSGNTESLNAAVAGSVILFEARRQRTIAAHNRPNADDVV
jgi:TrmH family RNA methyltransferase